MNFLWLGVFVGINLAMMGYWLFIAKSRGYGFPFFAGAVALALILPQGIALANHSELIPEGGFAITMLFASLCTVAIGWGFSRGLRCARRPKLLSPVFFNDSTLMRGALVFTLLGVVFHIALSRIDIQIDPQTGNWTGTATVLIFFARWLNVGFVMALYLALKNRDPRAWGLVGVALCFLLPAILFRGRRAEAMVVGAAVLLLLWFVRRRAIPRWGFVVAAIVMMFAMSAIGAFRKVMSDPHLQSFSYWERLELVDWSGEWNKVAEKGGGGELMNCVYGVSAANQLVKFDGGIPLWNLMIWSFVPGQIIGHDVKQALYLMVNWPFYATTNECYPAYSGLNGSMWLGYTDAFQSFWWMGWIVFFIISWFMGWFYRLADGGNPGAICLYTWFLTPALHTIPALTYLFWVNLVYLFVFCFPIVFFCRVRKNAVPHIHKTLVRPTEVPHK